MLNPVRSFNLKVLGWFWLTLLVSVLSIAVPAFVINQLSDSNSLHGKDRELLEMVSTRFNAIIEQSRHNGRSVGRALNSADRRLPFNWFIVDENFTVVAQNTSLRKPLMERFNSRRFWYFMQSEELREINLEWTRLIGPATLSSEPGWKLILWRPERPKPLDIFKAMPWWSVAGLFLLVTSLMSWLLVRSIAQPLNRLGNAFDAVGRGQVSHTIDITSSHSKDKRFGSNPQFARLFAQFNDMTARIAALMQNQKRQSADISHELRTPLTRLQMTLALVRKKSTDTQIMPLLERAEKESELLNLHIQRLSELTTLEARAIQAGRHTTSLLTVLGDLCDDAAFEARAMNISWQHHLIDARLNIYEEPFVTAIENVVRNAFKYAHSSVELRCEQADGHVVVTICDDGPGVAATELDKLTQAFYRTDSARHSDTGGLGLGLAIVAEAVRLNGGEMTFNLAAQGGLCVSLRFPAV
ncbi:ATP-binding protein [Alteromonas gilva]|uniref:histidine kinase n=1 Tax=Alteromonas gilva TaxID=2987522 RepID=A0ABT5L2R6_9ALTE|nr:ATP-binding protein [Alteromonas gilva]MDC8831327.1 ATP-binding protein [Alteromonas gilva]